MIPARKILEADVVIVGGGIGGAMAAISAKEAGAERVVVLEKCNVRRSGSGATGNDHFSCYIPEVHGPDIEPVLKEAMGSLIGQNKDPGMIRLHLEESFDIVKKWEEWGINMRPLGKWNFQGHALPGKPRAFLKFDGRKQKAVLAEQMKKHGVQVLNHHPVVELAKKDGRIAGALALDIGTPEPGFVLVKSPNVIVSTGLTHRLYTNAATPSRMFNTSHCPNCAGGQALGWRAGAKMVNMEMPNRHAGPKFFARAGKSTWIGVYRYPNGKLLGPFVDKATRYVGDITCDVWNSAYTDVLLNGSGPAYIDCTQSSPEDLAFMREGMISEGLTTLVDYMDRTGLDVSKHAVEFMQYEPHIIGRGLEIDIDGQTSIPGLYAAGDMVGNFRADIGGAAVYGWIAGGHAGRNAASAALAEAEKSPWVEERAAYYSRFIERKRGAGWKEANLGLQQIMDSYAAAGPHRLRSATLLTAGLKYLGDLRKNSEEQIKVDDGHSLMRAIESLDLMDNGEIIMHAALERRETRDMHRRSDYTFTNPLLADKFLTVRKQGGNVIKEWRPRRNA